MEQLHLVVMVIHFIWNALTVYAASPEGMQDLADIEAIVSAMEGQTTTAPSQPGSNQTQSTGSPQIIRK